MSERRYYDFEAVLQRLRELEDEKREYTVQVVPQAVSDSTAGSFRFRYWVVRVT